jgi:hypothetical protein
MASEATTLKTGRCDSLLGFDVAPHDLCAVVCGPQLHPLITHLHPPKNEYENLEHPFLWTAAPPSARRTAPPSQDMTRTTTVHERRMHVMEWWELHTRHAFHSASLCRSVCTIQAKDASPLPTLCSASEAAQLTRKDSVNRFSTVCEKLWRFSTSCSRSHLRAGRQAGRQAAPASASTS